MKKKQTKTNKTNKNKTQIWRNFFWDTKMEKNNKKN